MRNLVIYRQSLTIVTGKWNPPCRKENEGWILVKPERLIPLYQKKGGKWILMNHEQGIFHNTILKMKKVMEKMRTKNNRPIWNCKMTSEQKGGYRIYHLICKRIK
jgi:hypothetical protein